MPGREPMNPRGRQYALAGTLSEWTRLTTPTPRQRRALRLAYRGHTPRAFSRYGVRQWRALVPGTRIVVKDPFALLSIPVIADTTHASPVIVYRHPGAVLASFRRMGWKPDAAEFARALMTTRTTTTEALDGLLARDVDGGDADTFAAVWAAVHDVVLADTAGHAVTFVSHAELARGGPPAGRALAATLGLTWTSAMEHELSKETGTPANPSELHNLDRSPIDVADSWRHRLSDEDVAACERRAGATWAALERQTLKFDE